MSADIILEQLLDDKIIDREHLKLAYKILNNKEKLNKIEEIE